MTARRRSPVERIRRDLYKTQRGIGDAQALARGPAVYARRRLRRSLTRTIFQMLRDALR